MSKNIAIPNIESNQFEFMNDLDDIAYEELLAQLEQDWLLLEEARDYFENEHDDEFWFSE